MDGQVFGKSCTYGCDLTDRLCEAVFDDGTAYRYTYDANDCLVKEVQTTPDGVRTVTRGYDADSRETSVACGSARVEKTFDKLGRLSSIRRNGGKHTTTYIYETAADGGQTGRIKTVKNGSGQLMAIRYKGADYYYIRNGLMTITGLIDANGTAVVNYRYDSWGMLTGISGSMAGTLGKDNPYRFKGYYYDEETGMYYLKSRYYQPEICRFISADDISIMLDNPMSLWDKNLYVYGDNDPVNKKDDDGEIAQFVAMGIIGAVTNVGISFIASKVTGQDYGWKDAVVDAAVGALSAIIPAWEIKEVSRFYVYKDVIKGGVSKGVSVIGEFIKGGNTKESLGSAILSLATPDVAKYGKLGLLKEELLKEKVIETAINAPFEMAYSLITSAGKQARKTSASRKNSKVNNDYKVLRNRLVKRGRIAYHEIQYRYRGRIYYSRIYM